MRYSRFISLDSIISMTANENRYYIIKTARWMNVWQPSVSMDTLYLPSPSAHLKRILRIIQPLHSSKIYPINKISYQLCVEYGVLGLCLDGSLVGWCSNQFECSVKTELVMACWVASGTLWRYHRRHILRCAGGLGNLIVPQLQCRIAFSSFNIHRISNFNNSCHRKHNEIKSRFHGFSSLSIKY